jgi:DNA-binding NtrC family response regulator
MLRAHEWRGNVRELENTMHRAVLLAQDSVIGPEAILLTGGRGIPVTALQPQAAAAAAPAAAKAAASGVTSALVGRTVAAVERDLIIDTLQHCLGNRTHAANILGISIRTLRNKLKQYNEEGVPVPGAQSESDHFSAA